MIRISEGPLYEVTIINPFTSTEDATDERIASLRVYHAAHPGASFTQIEDLSLTYADPDESPFLELEFTPTNAGVFIFSFLNAKPIPEEGSTSSIVPFVYGSPSLLYTQLYTSRSINITARNVLREVTQASREIDKLTGRIFYPKWIEMRAGGSGSYILSLDLPIISISEMYVRGATQSGRSIDDGFALVDPSLYTVDNRHIRYRKAYNPTYPTVPDGFLDAPGDGSGGVFNPDDREGPCIRFRAHNKTMLGRPNNRIGLYNNSIERVYNATAIGFPPGNQNVLLKGFFGYTEEDVSTPSQIQKVGELLALRNGIIRWGDENESDRERMKHKTIMEKTDTHLWMGEAKDRLAGAITGDPEIDRILVDFTRPAQVGVV